MKALLGLGYERKFLLYQMGSQFSWGKTKVFVYKLYAPASTRPTDYTTNPVTDDYVVQCMSYTTLEASEEAASAMLHIQSVLEQRVALLK